MVGPAMADPQVAAKAGEMSLATRSCTAWVPGMAAVVATAHQLGQDNDLYAVAGAAACLLLRLVGLRYRINIPVARTKR